MYLKRQTIIFAYVYARYLPNDGILFFEQIEKILWESSRLRISRRTFTLLTAIISYWFWSRSWSWIRLIIGSSIRCLITNVGSTLAIATILLRFIICLRFLVFFLSPQEISERTNRHRIFSVFFVPECCSSAEVICNLKLSILFIDV